MRSALCRRASPPVRREANAPAMPSSPAKLMNGAVDLVAPEGRDQPLNLPPMAEANDIAVVSAALGARGGLEAGVIAMLLDQARGIGERDASVDEEAVHACCTNVGAVSGPATNLVNEALTIFERS